MPLLRSKKNTGRDAEKRAAKWLTGQGLSIVERNFHCRQGEIDLILLDQETLVFTEVRWRKHQSYGGALASVDQHKQRRLINAAQHFLCLLYTSPSPRDRG